MSSLSPDDGAKAAAGRTMRESLASATPIPSRDAKALDLADKIGNLHTKARILTMAVTGYTMSPHDLTRSGGPLGIPRREK